MVTGSRVPRHLGRVLDGGGTAVGTCFQIAEGVVVTACHVLTALAADTPNDTVQIDVLAGPGSPRMARVLFVDAVHDLAVLRIDTPLDEVVRGFAPTERASIGTAVVITGVSVVDDPGHDYRFLHATGAWDGTTVRNDEIFLGRLTARSVTQGMSGAPVRRQADDIVIGVVSGRYNSRDGWLRDTVWVARTEDLHQLAPEHVQQIGTSYGSAYYQLVPPPRAERVGSFRTPSELLDVNRAVVPYRQRPIDQELARWRDDEEWRVSALLLHGEGGQGKTRAARQCVDVASRGGWDVLYAVRSDGSRLPRVDDSHGRPLLVLMDYVDRWETDAVEQLVTDLRASARPHIRILMLSRTAKGMWRPVEATIDLLVDHLAEPIELREFTTGSVDHEIAFNEAASAFQRAMNFPEKTVRRPRGGAPSRSPLELHMEALAAVCADHDGLRPPRSYDVSAFLLRRERRFWSKALGERRSLSAVAFDVQRLERVAVIAALVGPLDDRSQAIKLLRETRLVDGDASADELLELYSRLYPPQVPDQLLMPMHPDRLAEDFLAECITQPGYAEMVESIVENHVPRRGDGGRRMFPIVSAVAERYPVIRKKLHKIVFDRPQGYWYTNSKGISYYLHKTEVTLRGGKPQTIYFFAKVPENAKGQPADLPEDRVVKENPRNGFLTISKKKV